MDINLRLAGRGFGKSMKAASQAALDEQRGTPAPIVEGQEEYDKQRAQKHRCPHAVRRYRQVPHPRYGAKVPHFTTWLEPERAAHRCVDRVLISGDGRAFRIVPKP